MSLYRHEILISCLRSCRCKELPESSSLSQNINDLYTAELRAELASALCFRSAGSKDAPRFPTNQINPPPLFPLLQMTAVQQGCWMTMTLPEILVFNQLSGGISGPFLPRRIPGAASFHSCLLQSQALRGLSQPRGFC